VTDGLNCLAVARPLVRYLSSGLRRDVCVVVASEGSATGQQVKAALEDHYDERLRPRGFYDALSALVETGHLAVEADGVEDRYELTTAGEEALRAHHEWLSTRLSPD
jgi:DNA-binding PadR family transcriptional regulator